MKDLVSRMYLNDNTVVVWLLKIRAFKSNKRTMPWQEASGYINNKKYHVLRIGHPERKKKEEFVSRVVEWVSNN